MQGLNRTRESYIITSRDVISSILYLYRHETCYGGNESQIVGKCKLRLKSVNSDNAGKFMWPGKGLSKAVPPKERNSLTSGLDSYMARCLNLIGQDISVSAVIDI